MSTRTKTIEKAENANMGLLGFREYILIAVMSANE